MAHSKKYWWDIWDIASETLQESGQNIWRVEVRAGKDELDKWALKRFTDFEGKAGDVVAHILKAMRYTDPQPNDNNRSRWPTSMFWKNAIGRSYSALAPYSTNAIRENILLRTIERMSSRAIARGSSETL